MIYQLCEKREFNINILQEYYITFHIINTKFGSSPPFLLSKTLDPFDWPRLASQAGPHIAYIN